MRFAGLLIELKFPRLSESFFFFFWVWVFCGRFFLLSLRDHRCIRNGWGAGEGKELFCKLFAHWRFMRCWVAQWCNWLGFHVKGQFLYLYLLYCLIYWLNSCSIPMKCQEWDTLSTISKIFSQCCNWRTISWFFVLFAGKTFDCGLGWGEKGTCKLFVAFKAK